MLKSSFKWIFLIVGTMIGAGYASGRELWQFFGDESGLAIILFAICFTISCFVIMSVSYRQQSTDYVPILNIIMGRKLSGIYDVLIFFYLFTTTVVMIAGSGATVQAHNYPYWAGVLVIVILLILLFLRDINGLLSMNQYIVPLLIAGLLYVLLSFIWAEKIPLFSYWHHQRNWTAAFPFTALNILPLIAVIGAIGHKIKSKSEIWITCVGSGLILGCVSYLYNSSLIEIADEMLIYEIPLFAILKDYPFKMVIFMSILLWFAIFTTAAAGVLGIVTRVQHYINIPLWLLVTFTLVTMIPLTAFGFSTLIRYIYPVYGVLNLYVLVKLLLYPFWNRPSDANI